MSGEVKSKEEKIEEQLVNIEIQMSTLEYHRKQWAAIEAARLKDIQAGVDAIRALRS